MSQPPSAADSPPQSDEQTIPPGESFIDDPFGEWSGGARGPTPEMARQDAEQLPARIRAARRLIDAVRISALAEEVERIVPFDTDARYGVKALWWEAFQTRHFINWTELPNLTGEVRAAWVLLSRVVFGNTMSGRASKWEPHLGVIEAATDRLEAALRREYPDFDARRYRQAGYDVVAPQATERLTPALHRAWHQYEFGLTLVVGDNPSDVQVYQSLECYGEGHEIGHLPEREAWIKSVRRARKRLGQPGRNSRRRGRQHGSSVAHQEDI